MTLRPYFYLISLAALLACSARTSQLGKPAAPPPPEPHLSAPAASVATREAPPSAMPSPKRPFPQLQHGSLPNGLSYGLAERRVLPLVQVSVLVHSGVASEGDHAGVARFTAQLLEAGGAGHWDSRALRETIDGLGTSLDVTTSRDATRWSLSVTTDKLPAALDVLSALVTAPRFETTEFKKLRDRELERVRGLARENGGWLAQMALSRALYRRPIGVHPYATVDVLPSELERLNLADCRQYHRTNITPKNAEIWVVGDVTEARLKDELKRAFGSWSGPAPAKQAIPAPSVDDLPAIALVHRPNSTQSDVLVGVLGPQRKAPDYPALAVAQHVLGGGVAGRLFLDVREKRSLAYSTYAQSIDLAHGPSTLMLSAGTRTAKTSETIDALLEHLTGIGANAITQAELDSAQRALVDGMPSRWETVEGLGGYLWNLSQLELPERYYDDVRDAISSVQPEAVRAAASRYYDRKRAVIVVAGDATVIAESLRQYGDVEVLDPTHDFRIERKLTKTLTP